MRGLFAIVFYLILACAIPAAAQNAPQRVALLLPLTGAQADLGQAMQNMAVMALFALPDSNVAIVPYDTGGRADLARAAYEKAVSEGAQIILGPLFSAELRAIKQGSRPDIPILSFSNDWQQAGGNTYIMGFAPQPEMAQLYSHLTARGTRFVHLLLADGAYGKEVENFSKQFAQNHAFEVTSAIRFQPQDARAMALGLKKIADSINGKGGGGYAKSYHAIVLSAPSSQLANLDAAMRQEDVSAENFIVALAGGSVDTNLAGYENLRGALVVGSPALARGDGDYKSYYAKPPLPLASLAYDAVIWAGAYLRDLNQGRRPLAGQIAVQGRDGAMRFNGKNIAERQLTLYQVTESGLRGLAGY